jgi:hypothetical protein
VTDCLEGIFANKQRKQNKNKGKPSLSLSKKKLTKELKDGGKIPVQTEKAAAATIDEQKNNPENKQTNIPVLNYMQMHLPSNLFISTSCFASLSIDHNFHVFQHLALTKALN